jgi:hypothetical protein
MHRATYVVRNTWNLVSPHGIITDRMMRIRLLNKMVEQAEILHSESGFC